MSLHWINFGKEVTIDQLVYTSGRGGDYRIVASSCKIRKTMEREIERNALVKYYLSPDIAFIDAIRLFPLPEDKYAISYVTEAGRDEYGRPERLRAHILMLHANLMNNIIDPRIFSHVFLREDVYGELEPIRLDVSTLLGEIASRLSSVKRKLPIILNMFNEDMLKAIISSILQRKKILIIPTNKVLIETVEKHAKITSMDIIVAFYYLLPRFIRERLLASSFAIHGEMENVNIAFLHPMGIIPKRDAVIIDLEEGKVYSVDKKGVRGDAFSATYIKMIMKMIQNERYDVIESIINMIDSSFMLLRDLGDRGAKLLQKIIDFSYERFMEGEMVD